ncbi:MAG: hypothetical protein ABIN67_14250 [Ferruginibacter sp.]
MNKLLLLISLNFFCGFTLFSQSRNEDFEITLPEQRIEHSLYNKISYLDSRIDTTNMGIVQLGAFNRKAKVVPKVPFSEQMRKVLGALTDSTAGNGNLLLQLRQFNFAEITGAVSEKGYCYLRAQLYANSNNGYQTVGFIDTVISVKSFDVTKGLFRNASNVLSAFISSNLLKTVSDSTVFSLHDIANMDSVEKRFVKLYNVSTYVDGVYTDWRSFANQSPDKQGTVELKDGTISRVKVLDENGKATKVKSKDLYAVVHNGQPFIATDFGYYPLTKDGNDLFFTGKAKVTANTGDVIAASMFFGILGGLMASDAASLFDMKLDHLNGGFIRLREIKMSTQ